MRDLKNRRIWITGASMGIGRSLTLELARRGAIMILTARGTEKLQKLQMEVREQGGSAIIKSGDVTDLERMKHIAKEAEEELGAIDILIANAGTHTFSRPEDFDTDEYLRLMDLNYGGTLRCIDAVLPGMLQRRAGRIVGVASLAGLRGLPRAAAYSASKGAVINFLQSIRFHLIRHDVHVTIVTPGFVRTPLTDKNDFKMPFLVEPERAARIIASGIAKGRKSISFPIPFNWTIQFLRVIPYPLYEWIITRVWRRMNVQ